MEDAELLDGSLACAENYDRFIAAADARRHDEAIATHAFLEGIEAGKLESAQEGFDAGYGAGIRLGKVLGQLRGICRALAHYHGGGTEPHCVGGSVAAAELHAADAALCHPLFLAALDARAVGNAMRRHASAGSAIAASDAHPVGGCGCGSAENAARGGCCSAESAETDAAGSAEGGRAGGGAGRDGGAVSRAAAAAARCCSGGGECSGDGGEGGASGARGASGGCGGCISIMPERALLREEGGRHAPAVEGGALRPSCAAAAPLPAHDDAPELDLHRLAHLLLQPAAFATIRDVCETVRRAVALPGALAAGRAPAAAADAHPLQSLAARTLNAAESLLSQGAAARA